MKKLIKIVSLVLFTNLNAFGQYSRFVKNGKIEFEKSINMYAVLKKGYDFDKDVIRAQLFDKYKSTHPQFLKQKSELIFTADKTLFLPEESEVQSSWGDDHPLTKQFNVIFTDLSVLMSTTQKDVYGNVFWLKTAYEELIGK